MTNDTRVIAYLIFVQYMEHRRQIAKTFGLRFDNEFREVCAKRLHHC